MAEDYIVKAGDCLNSIAYEHGFYWETLWSHPANAGLKAKRKNPDALLAGGGGERGRLRQHASARARAHPRPGAPAASRRRWAVPAVK